MSDGERFNEQNSSGKVTRGNREENPTGIHHGEI